MSNETELTPQEHAIQRTSATKHGLIIISLMIIIGGSAGYLLTELVTLPAPIEITVGLIVAIGVAHVTALTYGRLIERFTTRGDK